MGLGGWLAVVVVRRRKSFPGKAGGCAEFK